MFIRRDVGIFIGFITALGILAWGATFIKEVKRDATVESCIQTEAVRAHIVFELTGDADQVFDSGVNAANMCGGLK